MPGFDLSGVKKAFFDRKAVTDVVDKELKKELSGFGARVWKRSKTSLKYGKQSSAPGQIPIIHATTAYTKVRRNKKTGKVSRQAASPLRELTFFYYDAPRKSVIIGPVPKSSRGPRVLKAVEYGDAKHAARPWVRPAFQAELPSAKKGFKSLIK